MNYYQNYNNEIKNVLIFGLGGIGTVYTNIINKSKDLRLRVLVDKKRLKRYTENPRKLNGHECKFEYITPEENFSPDLIIIATKSNGLNDAIKELKNFVKDNTLIISLINGITSEEELAKHFGNEKLLYSYVICHSIVRNGNNITHDGVTKITFGDINNNVEKLNKIEEFFKKVGIDYEISKDIRKSLWEKFCFNCCVNQISGISGFTFREMENSKECMELIKNISEEINQIAIRSGIKGVNLVSSSFEKLKLMIPEGKTSMLQDIENGREPEIDLFGAEVLKLAKIYNIDVPYNKELYNKLKERISR